MSLGFESWWWVALAWAVWMSVWDLEFGGGLDEILSGWVGW